MSEFEQTRADLPAPEVKSVALGDVDRAFEEFRSGFEAWKAENDRRLAEIERRGAADPLTEEKMERIDRAMEESRRLADDLALKAARPRLGGERAGPSVGRASTRRPSTATSAPATTPACAGSRRRRSPSARLRTAVIWCRPNSNAR